MRGALAPLLAAGLGLGARAAEPPAAPKAAGVASTAPATMGVTLTQAVAEALERSPEVARAAREAELAGLEEPAILAALDPRFEAAFSYSDDQAPRAAPLFQGSRAQLESGHAAVSGNTLLGTEARLLWRNERLVNPSLFRVLDPSADSRLSLELRQRLLRYFWGRPDKARRGRARSAASQAAWRLAAARSEAAAAAARACLELGYAQEAVLVKEEGVADARRLLAKHEEKRRYGLLEPSDVLQARASLELQETERTIALSTLERARNALAAALSWAGPGARPAYRAEGLAGVPSPPEPAPAPDVSARPELRAARDAVEAAEWALRVERLDALPDLSLNASYAFAGLGTSYGGAWRSLGGFDSTVRGVGASLELPFAFRRERVAREQARLRLEAARSESALAERRARREAADAAEALRLARLRVEALARLLDLEGRKYEAEEADFRRGRSSTDVLIRFQGDIRRARLELSRARADEALAAVELARATGTLLERAWAP